MTKLLSILLLTCATLHAQTVIVKGTGVGDAWGTGAGNVVGVVAIETMYSSNRFSVWSDNTNVVVDNDSGLRWTRSANIDGTKDWTNAMVYCSNLTYAAYSDWRLPSLPELSRWVPEGGSTNGLIEPWFMTEVPALPVGHPFINIVSSVLYWSSTAYDAAEAYGVGASDGGVAGDDKIDAHFVWPVRGP